MKRVFWAVLIVLLAVSCSGKKETGNASASGNENVIAKSSGGSTATVKAGTPAPASDFTVELYGDGVAITDYTGNAKSLTIPATIEDLPVLRVNFNSLNPNVEQLFIPEGVKEAGAIGGYSNSPGGFPNLRAVSLPNTLESLSSFKGCTNLKSISIPPSVTHIVAGAFSGSGIQSIVIPASVEGAIPEVFKDCKSLTSVEISGNGLRIDGNPFGGCDNLKTVIINEGVTYIGQRTFWRLKLLETVKLPDSLTYIGEDAFSECSSLKDIVIPKGVESIRRNAFYGSGLTEVTIRKTNEPLKIYSGAFAKCENLVTVNFEEGVSIKFEGIRQFTNNPKLSLKSQAALREMGGL